MLLEGRLTETLEKVYEADAIIIGSPIYFGEPTGEVRSFMVRSTFPALSYDDYKSTFTGKIDVGIILTMNADRTTTMSTTNRAWKNTSGRSIS